MARSRLTRRLENKTKKTLLLTIIGIIAIIFLLVKVGVPLLVNVSLLIAGTKDTHDTAKKSGNDFIPPPVLNPLSSATNSAAITLSGNGSSKQTINLYVNNSLIDKIQVQDDNTFNFQNIILTKGDNTIKAKAITNDNKESDFSNTLSITFKKDPPTLSVDSPSDGQSFSKDQNSTNVSGKTDSGARITVNGFWAISDESGKFSYNLPLKNGDNQITVVSTDEAGNTTQKQLKVTYNP